MTSLLNKNEVARILGVTTITVERLVQRKQLPCTRILSCVKFKPEDVETLIATNRK